jgi:alpha-L-rhamnosidase
VPGKLPAARFIQSEKPVAAVWCFESLCGIKPVYDNPGFKHFLIAPKPPSDMTWAQAEAQTVHGTIRSRWERKSGQLVYVFTVPANTTATIRLPQSRKADGEAKGQGSSVW